MSPLRKVKFLNSIQVTLALAISLIVIVILSSIGWLLYGATDRVVEENSQETTSKIIKQVNYDIEYYLKTVETTIDSIKYSDVVAGYFDNPSEKTALKAIQYLDSLLVNREDIINIALIRPNGQIITNDVNGIIKEDVDYTMEPYYVEATFGNGMQVSSSHVQNILLGQYQWVVSCSSSYRLNSDEGIDGVILVDLNFNLIEDMVSRIAIGERGYIFIIDDDGELVYHPKRDLLYSGITQEEISQIIKSNDEVLRSVELEEVVDYIITDSDYSHWKVIGKVFVDDVNVYRETLRSYFVTMVLVALVIAIILAIILAGSILRPVKRLLGGISSFQSGELDVKVHVESENELGILTSSFNKMTDRIQHLIEENKLIERNKRMSELDALQAQINPHFLYNTLDSIVWMGEAGKSDEVVKMTSSLAKLFRISINKGKEYITLGQEIDHVESYLTIQQMRYGDKLDYTIEVDPTLLNVRIIKILVQPIVENAIYHGIKQLPGNGMISIRVRRNEGDLHIEIEDNGMGMDEETIAKLLSGKISPEAKGSGVGVYNVDQRIKLYYGDEYGLHIESEMFEGTIITLKLPMKEGAHHEEI